ncbi:Ku protein [Pseudoxanthomonas dokdonensis]|uniref:Non-homologous end joining protein Ku n=1 Tax=Pseudoxanthomonas dokdonensis TaxID=344882 RepID=A0A0R0CNN9_9GAMM|nr:Ku protein [Pseudoxanthomonas dokdonensis]KRG71613.1 DNA-binding protein [Pseudoxanthomonas dokdonensis]
MARPIWTGNLSFGLLNIPVSLMSGERKVDLHFRMLDSRDRKPIRFERVNAETGEEVPWKEIIKAYEYDKGNYVVVDQEDIKAAAPQSHETVEVETFVDIDSIDPRYFEKPYVLVPGKKAEKGYVLFRDTLASARKVGIGRVVIRTREYLCAVMPLDDALLMMLLRYPQELVDPQDYKLPTGTASSYRISPKELEMAEQLVNSMAGKWQPEEYHDEFRERLQALIQKRIKTKGATATVEDDDADSGEEVATNVVDFMSLLEKSLASNKRTPAKKSATKKAAGRSTSTSKSKKASKATKTTKASKSTRKAASKRKAG